MAVMMIVTIIIIVTILKEPKSYWEPEACAIFWPLQEIIDSEVYQNDWGLATSTS